MPNINCSRTSYSTIKSIGRNSQSCYIGWTCDLAVHLFLKNIALLTDAHIQDDSKHGPQPTMNTGYSLGYLVQLCISAKRFTSTVFRVRNWFFLSFYANLILFLYKIPQYTTQHSIKIQLG